jgi:hypothetical protein
MKTFFVFFKKALNYVPKKPPIYGLKTTNKFLQKQLINNYKNN